MKKRRITLRDGRYMLFFSFEDHGDDRPNSGTAPAESSSGTEVPPLV